MDTLKGLQEQNASVARNEQIKAELIDLAEKNSYAADDTEESIRDLADQIEELGLLNPLGVVEHHGRYTLFSGERRYKAITQHLHWETIPCRVFEGVSTGRAQLMLHIANGARDYSPARKLALYEEYHQLLEELKANGEFKGGIQKGIAELLNVSDRQVRTYRTISEALTASEKQAVQKRRHELRRGTVHCRQPYRYFKCENGKKRKYSALHRNRLRPHSRKNAYG